MIKVNEVLREDSESNRGDTLIRKEMPELSLPRDDTGRELLSGPALARTLIWDFEPSKR